MELEVNRFRGLKMKTKRLELVKIVDELNDRNARLRDLKEFEPAEAIVEEA